MSSFLFYFLGDLGSMRSLGLICVFPATESALWLSTVQNKPQNDSQPPKTSPTSQQIHFFYCTLYYVHFQYFTGLPLSPPLRHIWDSSNTEFITPQFSCFGKTLSGVHKKTAFFTAWEAPKNYIITCKSKLLYMFGGGSSFRRLNSRTHQGW